MRARGCDSTSSSAWLPPPVMMRSDFADDGASQENARERDENRPDRDGVAAGGGGDEDDGVDAAATRVGVESCAVGVATAGRLYGLLLDVGVVFVLSGLSWTAADTGPRECRAALVERVTRDGPANEERVGVSVDIDVLTKGDAPRADVDDAPPPPAPPKRSRSRSRSCCRRPSIRPGGWWVEDAERGKF